MDIDSPKGTFLGESKGEKLELAVEFLGFYWN